MIFLNGSTFRVLNIHHLIWNMDIFTITNRVQRQTGLVCFLFTYVYFSIHWTSASFVICSYWHIAGVWLVTVCMFQVLSAPLICAYIYISIADRSNPYGTGRRCTMYFRYVWVNYSRWLLNHQASSFLCRRNRTVTADRNVCICAVKMAKWLKTDYAISWFHPFSKSTII